MLSDIVKNLNVSQEKTWSSGETSVHLRLNSLPLNLNYAKINLSVSLRKTFSNGSRESTSY